MAHEDTKNNVNENKNENKNENENIAAAAAAASGATPTTISATTTKKGGGGGYAKKTFIHTKLQTDGLSPPATKHSFSSSLSSSSSHEPLSPPPPAYSTVADDGSRRLPPAHPFAGIHNKKEKENIRDSGSDYGDLEGGDEGHRFIDRMSIVSFIGYYDYYRPRWSMQKNEKGPQ